MTQMDHYYTCLMSESELEICVYSERLTCIMRQRSLFHLSGIRRDAAHGREGQSRMARAAGLHHHHPPVELGMNDTNCSILVCWYL